MTKNSNIFSQVMTFRTSYHEIHIRYVHLLSNFYFYYIRLTAEKGLIRITQILQNSDLLYGYIYEIFAYLLCVAFTCFRFIPGEP